MRINASLIREPSWWHEEEKVLYDQEEGTDKFSDGIFFGLGITHGSERLNHWKTVWLPDVPNCEKTTFVRIRSRNLMRKDETTGEPKLGIDARPVIAGLPPPISAEPSNPQLDTHLVLLAAKQPRLHSGSRVIIQNSVLSSCLTVLRSEGVSGVTFQLPPCERRAFLS